MEAWERRPNETEAAFAAFKKFLTSRERNVKMLAAELGKSEQLFYRWSHKFDWRERAAAYDNSLLEETRRLVKRELGDKILRRYEQADILQEKAFANLQRLLDSNPRSLKSLTELYFAAQSAQWALYERLTAGETSEDLRIVIENAGGADNETDRDD